MWMKSRWYLNDKLSYLPYLEKLFYFAYLKFLEIPKLNELQLQNLDKFSLEASFFPQFGLYREMTDQGVLLGKYLPTNCQVLSSNFLSFRFSCPAEGTESLRNYQNEEFNCEYIFYRIIWFGRF